MNGKEGERNSFCCTEFDIRALHVVAVMLRRKC
jgi:hypothetical protein